MNYIKDFSECELEVQTFKILDSYVNLTTIDCGDHKKLLKIKDKDNNIFDISSDFISSQILQLIGYPVEKIEIGTFNGIQCSIVDSSDFKINKITNLNIVRFEDLK